jgi:quercetin dioxygenase-like cupin family protein
VTASGQNEHTDVPTATVVVETTEFTGDLEYLVDRAGFLLQRVMPADDPTTADLNGHGVRLRLRRGSHDLPARLVVPRVGLRHEGDEGGDDHDDGPLVSPGGTTIDFERSPTELTIPPGRPELIVTHAADGGAWVTGRAGMRYRDLLPGRWGGRFIASHIHIPDGGPVPDYVHHHAIRFQLIAVKEGWVEVVYEDQGPPFVMAAGDCVLQPPHIRHRVLRSSPGLEVVEVGCPAEHETLVDHDLDLPTEVLRPDRDYSGQRFVRHIAADTGTAPWRLAGWTARDSGIARATSGLLDVRFVALDPSSDDIDTAWAEVDTELLLLVVMRGTVDLDLESADRSVLCAGDSVALPSRARHRLPAASGDLELMVVMVPADHERA